MSSRMIFVCALTALLLPAMTMAQEDEAESPPFAYGTYFECDANREWLADAIVEQLYKPIYDEAVSDGTLSAWGYLAHHTGGKWRRVLYQVAPTIEGVMAAVGTLGEKAEAANAQAVAEFGSICSSHDDYLWQSVVGSSGTDVGENRGAVGFSTYLHCNEATETDADEVVKTVFAPIYDAQVAAGNLVSWGYMQHWVGGEYRRLLTMTAVDLPMLIKGRDSAVNAMVEMEEAAGDFFAACTSHSDYIWDIKQETP